MEQGLQEGTIRNSHRDSHAVKAKRAPNQVAEKARALIERCSESGTVIRQHLDIDRMKQPLQKGLFYVIENDSNADPGFLVFLPGQQAPVYINTRKHGGYPCTLRMRVSPTLGDGGGSVFVATLDPIQHTLRLEDVWMWKGAPIFDTTCYSKRREHLKEFVERLWVPDARLLGGVVASLLNPKSIAEYLQTAGPGYMIEFLPELPGRRRMWHKLGEKKEVARAPLVLGEGGVIIPQANPVTHPPVAPRPPPRPQYKPAIEQPVEQQVERKALAKPIEALPDIYNLYDEQGLPISRASVQSFSLAQEMRKMTGDIWVTIRWRPEFGGYEINRLDTSRR
uniref:Uncharacterized protein n=1 Tax=viral metagenome TaxID=1070528 RepID=A0A6C0JX81_9ZZZZ